MNAKTAPALPAPTSVVVTAGDGANTITWSVTVRTALAVYVFRSRSAGGPWALLTPKGVRGAARYVDPVPEPGTWYYIVARGVKSGIPINASTPAGNDRVSIARVLGPAGGRIEAANGALELDVPEGALVTTETITIEQVSGQRSAGVLLLAPVYACGPDGLTFARAATLTLHYRIPVTHFQVAGTLERACDLAQDQGSGWTIVPGVVNGERDTVSGQVTHFSYWSAGVIQPHGTTPAKTSYCSGICHSLVTMPGASIGIPVTDRQVCYNCHGNTLSTVPPAGSNGPNVEARFFECDEQTKPTSATVHPVTSGLLCTDCHNPHRDPTAGYTGLLRAIDAVTNRAVESKPGSPVGPAFCWACHGTKASARIEARIPGYWSRTGGDRKTGYAPSAHASVDATAGVTCVLCHDAHGGPTDSLLPTAQALTCTRGGAGACHSSGANAVGGSNVFSQFTTSTNDLTHHDVMPKAQTVTGARIRCTSCHDPHRDTVATPAADPDDQRMPMNVGGVPSVVAADGSVYVLVGAAHDGTPPQITNLALDGTGDRWNAPVITWTTNEPATSWIDWGLTTAYERGNETSGMPFGNANLVTAHSVQMTGLEEGVTYHYRVRTTDALGNTRYSADMTFGPMHPPPAPVPDHHPDVTIYSPEPVTFTWSPVVAPDGDPVEYQVYIQNPANWGYSWYSGWLSGASYVEYGLKYTGSVTWQVRARDKLHPWALSAWSSPDTFYLTDTNPDPSCPTLYTWDGERFRFITDVMGLGSIGVKKGPSAYLKPEPVEDSVIPQGSLVPKDGALELHLTDEKEEIEFVDEVKLVAVDHPAGTRVLLNDLHWGCFDGGREPTRYFTVRDPRPVRVTYERRPVLGTATVPPTDVSHEVAGEGDGLLAYSGLYDDNIWTFDLGELEDPAAIKLIVSGWVDYADRGEKAAWLASGKRPPESYMEVLGPDGSWVRVGDAPHIPGYPKTVVYDLSDMFPEGVTRYVVRMRIYMRMNIDYVAVDTTADETVTVRVLEPRSAWLTFKGVSRYRQDPYPVFMYESLVSTAPGTQKGAFTRFGDVRELLLAADDEYVVMNTGDDIEVTFDEPDAPADGYQRTYVLHTDGYHQTQSGSVDPMPFHAMSNYPYGADEHYPDDPEHVAYLAEYNTRWCNVEAPWLTRHEPVTSAEDAASGPFSIDTDIVALVVKRAGGVVTTLTPVAAWESVTSTATSLPTIGAPGTAVPGARLSAVHIQDGTHLRTDLATAEGAWNWQVFRFDPAEVGGQYSGLTLLWRGHGEPTANHFTRVAHWDPASDTWMTLRNAQTASDVSVGKTWLTGASTLCLRCHDGAPPPGVVFPSGVFDVGSTWSTATGDAHGPRDGSGWVALRTGFTTNMDLPCSACHDAHGNRNLYHFTPFPGEAVNVSVTNGNSMKYVCAGCHAGSVANWHAECVSCHAYGGHGDAAIDSPETWTAYNYPNETSDCTLCHNHGSRSNVNSDNGRGVDERARRSTGDCHYCHYWDTTF